MANFAARWIQSASRDLDVIVASTITGDWARMYRPVFSNSKTGHVLYTEYKMSQPNGQLVLCPLRCVSGLKFKEKGFKTSGKGLFTCLGCGRTCSIVATRVDRSTVLGHENLAKTPFLQQLYEGADWELPKAR